MPHSFTTTVFIVSFLVTLFASCSPSNGNPPNPEPKPKGLSVPLIPPLHPRSPFYPQILEANNITISDITSQQIALNRTHYLKWLLNSESTNAHEGIRWTKVRGHHIMDLVVGTNHQIVEGIFDTGSDVVWFQGEARAGKTRQPYFSQSESTTFKPINCGDTSKCMANPSITSCPDPNQPCSFNIKYADGTFTRGSMATDVLNFLDTSEKWNDFIFGVSSNNSDEMGGIIGASNSYYAIPRQLYPDEPVFSYCMSEDWNKTSLVKFGYEANLSGHTLNVMTNPHYHLYYMDVLDILVNGRDLGIDPSVFKMSEDGSRGFVIDSGSTLTSLTFVAFDAVKVAVERIIGKTASKRIYYPICYPSSTFGRFWPKVGRPSIGFRFTDFVYDVPEKRAWEEFPPGSGWECLKVAPAWTSVSVLGYDMLMGVNVGYWITEHSGARGRTPREKTPSFRGENEPQKWYKRQFSRQMSSQRSGEEVEYAAAVAAAAAAIAITSLDDAMDQTRIRDGQWTPLPRTRSKIADISSSMAEAGEKSKSYADKDLQKHKNFEATDAKADDKMPESTIRPASSIKKAPSMPKETLAFADQLPQDYTAPSVGRTPTPKKTPSSGEEEDMETQRIKPAICRKNLPIRKTPTFVEEAAEGTKRRRPAVETPIIPSPVPPPAIPPLNIQAAVPPKLETEVDAWERHEMAKIKERYEKLNATILEWEDKKKKKARRKLETAESELDTRRAKVMHKYRMEMEQIKQIADGARPQAKDKKRNEEWKVKEKADRQLANDRRRK
ncbi:hypothetical protein Cgig2_023180 [Carnegiea gigantea]|uniref:Peptidase A1 domain-containing protein n=1 Tax=Carnegiea gigantea TaxID=171969 RepID=A0A9Q1Q8U6_9CARY|nr:hypothetical protein Cgig2_023180 [Carnegiea gigantea]